MTCDSTCFLSAQNSVMKNLIPLLQNSRCCLWQKDGRNPYMNLQKQRYLRQEEKKAEKKTGKCNVEQR